MDLHPVEVEVLKTLRSIKSQKDLKEIAKETGIDYYKLYKGCLWLSEKGLVTRNKVEEESFENNLLEAPTWSRPAVYKNFKNNSVVSEMFKGNHSIISSLRSEMAIAKTKYHRPDIYNKFKTRKKYEK